MDQFFILWQKAAYTSLGLFWMAFWAFGLGYLVSSMIQVFVTQKRMRESIGDTSMKSVGLASFFGFISSSCSFAALSTTRALFAKGAGFIPSLAFLLGSTNLVIELGIVISLFLGWQFVVGEYVGGLLLIGLMWALVRFTYPKQLIETAREHAQSLDKDDDSNTDSKSWREQIMSRDGWFKVAKHYIMEWNMVWQDVTIGFTVAGIIAAFVPTSFFQSLFLGAGTDAGFFEILVQTIVGPVAAFVTFIGSMGNIPLAAVLFGNGVSFAGVMAFIFSDLVVLPVLRIQAKYYGWKMAFYISFVFLVVLVISSLLMHYGLNLFDQLPSSENVKKMTDREFFKLNYTAVINGLFVVLSACFILWFKRKNQSSKNDNTESKSSKASDQSKKNKQTESKTSITDKILACVTSVAIIWLVIGACLSLLV